MIEIKSCSRSELAQLMADLGQPAFRAKQVFQWLHRGVASFDEMSNLPKSLREQLKERCVLTVPQVERDRKSVV